MKKVIVSVGFFLFLLSGGFVFAQDIENQLNAARMAYSAGDLEGARFALQEAINAVDLAIGEEIMELLPERMGEMSYNPDEDQLGVANMGFAGLHLSRRYGEADKPSVEVSLIADSPLLAGINAILAMPFIASDSDQKKVRVGGYRGLLQKSEGEDGEILWDLQIPFGSSLLSVAFRGIPEENTVIDLAATVPVDQMAAIIQ